MADVEFEEGSMARNPHNYLIRINEKGAPAINRCGNCGEEGPTELLLNSECLEHSTPARQRRDVLRSLED